MAFVETGVPSPCVGLCRLNDDDYCLGCYRHRNEIKDWGTRPDAEKQAILQQLPERRYQFTLKP